MTSIPTTDQAALIRSCMRTVLPKAEALGARFYDELFARAPEVRPLFPEHMGEQRAKLVATLAAVVRHVDELPAMGEELDRLGRLHGELGATAEAYDLVGEVLLDVLAELCEPFGDAERAAWASAYGEVSRLMQEAAG